MVPGILKLGDWWVALALGVGMGVEMKELRVSSHTTTKSQLSEPVLHCV